jgi:hypothetical protein
MKRTLFCTVMALLATLWVTPSADAVRVRVTMNEPRMVAADAAELSGRVRGRDVVLVQRYAETRERWVDVRRTRANSEGRYRTTVTATEARRYYRAVAGGRSSAVRVVVGEPVLEAEEPEEPTEPETPTEPEEPTEPETPTDACGARPAKDDGGLWACTLAENFSGTTLNRTLWKSASGFLGGTAPARPCYVDDPSVISVQDGTLRLSARAVAEPIKCPGTNAEPTGYIAGGVNTYRLFSQQYGRFEARFKSTATREVGLHEAFWLWPDDRYNTALWPAAGEIDIAETYSQYPDLSVPFLHYTWNDNGGPKPGVNTAWNCAAKRGEYNTYTLEWTATRLEILVNGKTCLVNTSGDPAFQKPYIVALTQLMGTGPNMYDGKAPMPATMTVDYVKVWR